MHVPAGGKTRSPAVDIEVGPTVWETVRERSGHAMTRGEATRPLTLLLFILLLSTGILARSVRAAPTGEFKCSVPSGGPNDGNPCQTHADCPGGACVYVQGVCNDQNGLPCLCPGGTCSGDTCSGGPFAGQTCDTKYNCNPGVACQGSQKVCVGGSNTGTLLGPGYSCLNDQQCDSSQCRSTGRVCVGYCNDQNQSLCPCPDGTCGAAGTCSGGLLDGFSCDATMKCSSGTDCVGTAFAPDSCGQDADCCMSDTACPVGGCFSPAAVPTPTTPGAATPTATASRTPTRMTPSTGTMTPRPPSPIPTRSPANGMLVQAIGEGGGCATAADGSSRSFAVLAGTIGLWLARRRSGAA